MLRPLLVLISALVKRNFICARAEIGRRDRLKICCRKTCGFKSHRAYHLCAHDEIGENITGLNPVGWKAIRVRLPVGTPRLYKLLLDSRTGKNYQEKFLINPLTNPKKFDIIKMFQRTAPWKLNKGLDKPCEEGLLLCMDASETAVVLWR